MYQFKHDAFKNQAFPVEVIATVVTIADLKDDRSELFERHNNFGTWNELFASSLKEIRTEDYGFRSKKKLSYKIVTIILETFFECLIRDLIYENDIYKFPYRFFAKLKVWGGKNRKSLWHPFIYPIHTRGKVYSPMVIMSKKARKRLNNNRYHLKFTKRWRDLLDQEIRDGHDY